MQLLGGEHGLGQEDLPVRPEPDAGTGDPLGHPTHLGQPALGDEPRLRPGALEPAGGPAAEADRVGRPVAVDLDVEPGGQRVHHGRTNTVQPTGSGVGTPAELPAGMQLGHHDLDAGQPGPRLGVHGDAAPVVVHLGGSVRVEHDLDGRAMPGQGLVDGVVDDLPQAVHQTAAVGRPDVHPGAFADSLQALQDQQVARGVPGTGCGRTGGGGGAGGHVPETTRGPSARAPRRAASSSVRPTPGSRSDKSHLCGEPGTGSTKSKRTPRRRVHRKPHSQGEGQMLALCSARQLGSARREGNVGERERFTSAVLF